MQPVLQNTLTCPHTLLQYKYVLLPHTSTPALFPAPYQNTFRHPLAQEWTVDKKRQLIHSLIVSTCWWSRQSDMKDVNNFVQVISFVNVPGTGQCGQFFCIQSSKSGARVQLDSRAQLSWLFTMSHQQNVSFRFFLWLSEAQSGVFLLRLMWYLNLFNALAILPLLLFFFNISVFLAEVSSW